MAVLVGTSGYSYPHWQGRFYPKDLPKDQWLEYYAEHFHSVELNVTFYRLPASPTFRHWRLRTPKDFRFVLKGSRFITHLKRLRDCHEPLVTFVERASELGEKLSCMLWQLPPKFPHDVELLEHFLQEVERIQLVYGKFRQAFEFRDRSWLEEPVYDILKQFNVAIALADWPFNLQLSREIDTADFLYFRCHGPGTRYASPYTEEQLQALAKELQTHIEKNRDLYVFFNNDAKAYAVENAKQLRDVLSRRINR